MERIPDLEIARLKKDIPIERLVTGFGMELWEMGTGRAFCPRVLILIRC